MGACRGWPARPESAARGCGLRGIEPRVQSSNAGWPRRSVALPRLGASEAGRRADKAEREAQVAAQSAAEERRMQQAAELMESLAEERDQYLHAVEHEVVKLALAVAARILRREAQMDPLLLTGAVRVALGQLSAIDPGAVARAPGRAGLVERGHCPGAEPGGEAGGHGRGRDAAWATA